MDLLPFRAWQLYDAMVEFVKEGKRDEFIVAAGTLAHYIGDACQPLHISFLHHGDPDNPVTKEMEHTQGKKAGTTEPINLSQGVHEDYEQTMFRGEQGEEMKTKLQDLLSKSDSNGTAFEGRHDAAVATVQLMMDTFDTIHPKDICDAYDAALREESPKGQILSMLWEKFGDDTVKVMADGCHHLALLWESAWAEGNGERTMKDLDAAEQKDLIALYDKKTFLQSFLLTQIGPQLKGGSGDEPVAPKRKRATNSRR